LRLKSFGPLAVGAEDLGAGKRVVRWVAVGGWVMRKGSVLDDQMIR